MTKELAWNAEAFTKDRSTIRTNNFPNAAGGKNMTMKKTERVPVAADGIPIVVQSQQLDKTSELPVCAADIRDSKQPPAPVQAAPCTTVDDEVTVPVQSSIESTLTFEVLRRQSTEEDEEKP